jgi:hypothetical protein
MPEDDPHLNIVPGVKEEIHPHMQLKGEERFNEALRVAELGGDHLWVAITSYLVDPTKQLHLDHENICGAPIVGCYRCEEDYTPNLAMRRCKGTARWEKVE